MKCAQKYFYLFFIVLHIVVPSKGEHEEDSWLEPDAWARDLLYDDINRCSCSSEQPLPSDSIEKTSKTNDEVAFVYFKKFIYLLFSRKELMYDAKFETYERSLTFSLQSSQLEKLERLQDPRDLDNVLTEIFEKARNDPYMFSHGQSHKTDTTGFKVLILDIFRDMWQLTQTSEIRFLLLASLAVIFGWFLHKRYNISCFALLGGSLFFFGYLHTYLECNRELEVTQMLEILEQNEQSERKQRPSGFMGYLSGLFSASNSRSVNDQQLLRKSSKISLGFCRPDHVLIMYFNDIFLKYLEVLLEQCTRTLATLQASLSFPYNIFAGFFLICIIGYILKLTFKHILSPAAWSHLMQHKSQTNSLEQQPALTQANANSHVAGDRLSGENLKLLLNAINSGPYRSQTINAVSGVEEVRESIEPAPPITNKGSSSPAFSDKKLPCKFQDNNNTSKEQGADIKEEVMLEDVPEDC